MTDFIRRTKEESPFYAAALRNQWPTANEYGEKVDAFNATGVGTVTRLSHGGFAEREDAYSLLPRSTRSGVPPSEDGGSGRSATPRLWLVEDREALTNT